jgi:hypothetical protein
MLKAFNTFSYNTTSTSSDLAVELHSSQCFLLFSYLIGAMVFFLFLMALDFVVMYSQLQCIVFINKMFYFKFVGAPSENRIRNLVYEPLAMPLYQAGAQCFFFILMFGLITAEV